MNLKQAIDTHDFEMGLHYGQGKYFIEPEKMDEAREVFLKYLDMEEELGVDLLTFVKALKEGIYVHLQEPYGIVHDTVRPKFEGRYVYLVLDTVNSQVCCSNYGESWALTKEDLEK